MKYSTGIVVLFSIGLFAWAGDGLKPLASSEGTNMTEKIEKSEEEWKHCLNAQQYRVIREKGTEMPFTGKLLKNKESGIYTCAACGAPLFKSSTKFDSGTGWPSFWEPVSPEAVTEHVDKSIGMERKEITCRRCGGHLGHVFDDGPNPTGLRYCINSVSLDFEKENK